MTRSGKAIFTAAALVFAVGACGSSGSSNSLKLNPGANNNPLTKSNGGGKGNGDISSLLDQSSKKTYKVTFTGSSGDSITVVNKPPLAAYIQKDSSEYQTADNKLVTCEGTGSTATCTSVDNPSGGNIGGILTLGLGSYGQLFKTYASLLGGVKSTSEKIAGRDAECVTVDISKFDPSKPGSVVYCADKELGVVLRIRTTDNGKTENVYEATAVSTNVSNADVTPPVKPQTISVPSFTVPTYTTP